MLKAEVCLVDPVGPDRFVDQGPDLGALIAVGLGEGFSNVMGFIAIMLASVNIFGGFIVTQRMLQMFRKKKK